MPRDQISESRIGGGRSIERRHIEIGATDVPDLAHRRFQHTRASRARHRHPQKNVVGAARPGDFVASPLAVDSDRSTEDAVRQTIGGILAPQVISRQGARHIQWAGYGYTPVHGRC